MTPEEIYRITRPHRKLMWLYLIRCMFTGPFLVIPFIPAFIRYHTLRYRFDEEGIGVAWGFLFRHETYITYARIQDIHLSRGIFERWLGLGTVDVQTAAGSSSPEVSIVGLEEHEALRDFLYTRMRGFRVEAKPAAPAAAPAGDAVLETLTSIRDELRALRQELEKKRGP